MFRTRTLKLKLNASLCTSNLLFRFSSLRRRRLHSMPPTYPPVSSVDDIKNRCASVFALPDFQHIAWVGVFGSFSRGEQSIESDIDLLVGFKEGTSTDEVFYMPDLKEHLHLATRRDVDILYMYNKQSPNFIRAQALLTAKTIYEVYTWLQSNRAFAAKLMTETHQRLTAALHLGSDVIQQADVMNKQDTFQDTLSLEELIRSAAKLAHTLLPEDPDAKSLVYYFKPVSAWTAPVLELFQQFETKGADSFETADRRLLLRILNNDLPLQMRLLRNIFMPILEKALADAQIQYHGPYDQFSKITH